jgi:hypothetical protein
MHKQLVVAVLLFLFNCKMDTSVMQDNNRDSLSKGNILTDSEYAPRYQPVPKSIIKSYLQKKSKNQHNDFETS